MAIRAFLALMLASGTGYSLAQPPHVFGSWTLDGDESVYPGPVPRSQVRTYFPLEDDYYVGVAVTIDADGNANFLQFTAKPDGEDYPEYDVFALAVMQMAGLPTTASYSEVIVDERTVEWTDKVDGEPYLSGTRSISVDGTRLTIEFSAPNEDGDIEDYLLVYDRQE